jgi:hypothetical protein
MPEKQKTRNWKDPKTIIATVSVTALVTLWNTFASYDRQRTGNVDPLESTPTPSITSDTAVKNACATPIETANLGKRCVSVTHTRTS